MSFNNFQKLSIPILISIFFILISHYSISGQIITRVRSNYGEACNKTLRCRSQAWLTCDSTENQCRCIKPNEMIFDTERSKCVVLIGERCRYEYDQNDDIYSHQHPAMIIEKSDCVLGAECDPSSGLCKCPRGSYEEQDGTACTPVKDFGTPCSSEKECDDNHFLKCVNGTCDCDPETELYNHHNFRTQIQRNTRNYHYNNYDNNIDVPGSVCVGKVGHQCDSDRDEKDTKFCIQNAQCQTTCQCVEGYFPTSQNLCGLGHGQTCDPLIDKPCSDSLRCLSELCSCPNPSYEIYSKESQACRGLIGAPCDPTNPTSCIYYAECSEDSEGLHQCKCTDGFMETGDGTTCEIAYGARCTAQESNKCDSIAELQCKDNKCQCQNDIDIYEEERRQCSRPIGVPCKVDKECVNNSVCHRANEYGLQGRCKCGEGFMVDAKNRTCMQKEEMEKMDMMSQSSTPASVGLGQGLILTIDTDWSETAKVTKVASTTATKVASTASTNVASTTPTNKLFDGNATMPVV